MAKKIGMSYIYNKLGFFFPVTIILIYNSYFFSFYKNNFIFSYISPYFFCKNKYNFLKQLKITPLFNEKINFLVPLNIFYINQLINVMGISKGKGFCGVIKRHNFKSGDFSHGNSKAHNKPGSIGMCQDPGRVYKGKKMPGRLGGYKIFSKNTKILNIDFSNNIFYLKGSISGCLNTNNILIFPSNI